MQSVPQFKLSRHQWYVVLLIFVLSVFARLSYGLSAEHDIPIRADAQKYAMIGINLVENGTYAYDESGISSKLITPGYPFIVAAFVFVFGDFPSAYIAIIGFQILLSSLVTVLSYVIALRFLNDIGAGMVAVGVAISPHLIISSSYFLTETTHSFFLICALFLLLLAYEKRVLALAVLAGLVFGYSALIRPAVLLYPLPLICLIWWKYRDPGNMRLGLCFMLAAFLLWMPWQLWDAESEDSNVRQVFALGAYPDMIHESPQYRGFPYQEDAEFQVMQGSWEATREILSSRFAERPLTYLHWYLIGKPIMLWSAWAIQGQGGPFIYPIISSVYNESSVYASSLLLMMNLHEIIFWFAVIAVAMELFALLLQRRTPNFILMSMILFVMYHTAVHMVLAPLPRFSFPYYPILYMLAAYGITAIVSEARIRLKND